jgi:hypothetical protein
MVMGRAHQWVNFAAFQMAWLIAVWGAAGGLTWLGPVAVLGWVSAYAFWQTAARADLALLVGAGVLGGIIDSVLVLLGVIAFPESAGPGFPTTVWMVALWVNFAAALRHSVGWLCGRFGLGTVFGAIGGPLAYLAGEKLGAINIQMVSGVVIAWLIAMPCLLLLELRTRPQCPARPIEALGSMAPEEKP